MIIDRSALEDEILKLGKELFKEIQDVHSGIFDPEFYSGKLMDWAMRESDFKTSLFRFVDVFPSLKTSAAIVKHAQEYFESAADKVPGLLKWGLRVDPNSISAKLSAPIISHQIRSMGKRFILGEDPKEAIKPLRAIRKEKMAFTVDLLGEASVSEKEAEDYLQRYLVLIRELSATTSNWQATFPLIEGHKGEVTPLNVSVKPSALYSQIRPLAFERSLGVLCERFSLLLREAKKAGAFICIDMEDSSMISLTIELFKKLLSQQEFCDYDRCGIVLQTYLRRTEEDLEGLLKWVRGRGTPVSVRLVKGAYWDTETIYAIQRGWPIPVWQNKSNTDASYERNALTLLANTELIYPAFGSHNLRSLCFVSAAAQALKVAPVQFELQALYGMADPIKRAFTGRGYLVRQYAPVGALIPGMGYLVRRLLENTSNEGFLRHTYYDHVDTQKLLEAPPVVADKGDDHLTNKGGDFKNVPPEDFTIAANREAVQREVDALRVKLKKRTERVVPELPGGVGEGGSLIPSISPEDPKFELASVRLATKEEAEKALLSVHEYFPEWRETPIEKRAGVLIKAAELLEARRRELIAVMVLEAGKPWAEADGDVGEAIDFCRYYAQEAQNLFKARELGSYPGERNLYFYEPRGVTLVIAPWNFPLAIPCGMFGAALVSGNCVLFKPSTQTALTARYLFDIFRGAGMPERAACFLPCSGRDVADYLASHRLVSTIVFTGSKEVGLRLVEKGGVTATGAEQVKKVIAEMGGKNAIVIDEDADLDEAVKGVLYSAFGYAGQKCSACSRLVIVGGAYERFLDRFREAVSSIAIGPASNPASFLGPVIEESAKKRIDRYVEIGKKEAKLLVEGGVFLCDAESGYYVRPTVFIDVPLESAIWREEIFGPVLSVVNAPSFETAISFANDSEFALTGAIYSRSPLNIKRGIEQFRVGNLYINRGSTGALVYRQPFGGFRMSGVGSKAGGPDYLLQFVVPRSVSENTVRRGFAPS